MISSPHQAEIGVFGGSGFYDLGGGDAVDVKIDTPYGPPSDRIAIVTLDGKSVAFLPRHGREHQIPPHKINFRANLWAMKQLGVTRILAPSAVGSLQTHIEPGHFVVNDQFVDRTNGRADTFYDGPVATHISTAEPYCPELRQAAVAAARASGVIVHDGGTCVVIQGPRFSSKAESRWFTAMGWHVVTMTQYPEVALARELAMCYVNISLVTDYDAGIVGGDGHVQATDVLAVLKQNTEKAKRVVTHVVEHLDAARVCECGEALRFARME